MQETSETQVWSLSQEDPLEEGKATHSSIIAWRIPRTEEPSELQSIVLQRTRHNWSDLAHTQALYASEKKKQTNKKLKSHLPMLGWMALHHVARIIYIFLCHWTSSLHCMTICFHEILEGREALIHLYTQKPMNHLHLEDVC